jgi:hypothetical protein
MKAIRITALVILIIVAVNGLVAGFLFMMDPSGSYLGLNVEVLQYAPFKNFLIPGIALFVFNGVFNVVAATYTIFRWKGWKLLVLLQGLVLFGWIIIQVILLRELHYLHFIFAGAGVLLILLAISGDKNQAGE